MASKTAKTVNIIATYYHKTNGKLNGTVTYLVRASNGIDTYCTTLVDGKATGCSCPASRGKCYHRTQLEQKAVARKEVASQFSAKHAPSWLVELVAKGVLVAPKQVVSTVAQPVDILDQHAELMRQGAYTKPLDLSTRGNLNGNEGFSLLKRAV